MIRNPARLYEGCPPGIEAYHRLRVLEWFLLKPLGEVWDVTITSAYRNAMSQAGLYGLDPSRAGRKAKGVSQHVLGEAVDIVPDGGKFEECFLWCLVNLRPWQAILEYQGKRPECIHLSIPSERAEVAWKRLLFYDGLWRNYDGNLPTVTA